MRLRRASSRTSLCLAVTLLACAPAQAAAPIGGGVEYGTEAYSGWIVSDSDSEAFVAVGGVDSRGLSHAQPAASSDRSTGVFIDQAYCDRVTDELVAVTLKSIEPASEEQFRISPALDSASLTRGVELTGFEQRLPGCEDPRFEEATYSDLGPFPVSVTTRWTGTGPISHTVNNGQHGQLPDCAWGGVAGYLGRQAHVTASITGALPRALDLSQLGEPVITGLGTFTGAGAFADLAQCFEEL